jgi:hypothetical protein
MREQVYADFLRAGVPCMNWTPEATQWDALHRLVCTGHEDEGLLGDLSAFETEEAA